MNTNGRWWLRSFWSWLSYPAIGVIIRMWRLSRCSFGSLLGTKHGYGQLAGNTTADAFGSDHVVPILKPQVMYLSGFSVKWYVE